MAMHSSSHGRATAFCLAVVGSCWLVAATVAQEPVPWAQWRGPDGTGSTDLADPPIRWSEKENLRWKTPLPGLGHSSPIVWEDHVFVTTAVPIGEPFPPIPDNAPGSHDNLPVRQRHAYRVLAIHRETGQVLWEKTLNENTPHEGGHYSASLASASPVTDGKHVIAFFGSHGLYCLDFDGNLLWEKQLGKMHSKHAHGEGASPALFEDTLVINWDHEAQSFIAALDVGTGEERWRQLRTEVTSWASPIVVETSTGPQVVVAGSDKVRGYDLADGSVIWECGGMSQNIVATPVAAEGMVFVGSSYDIRAMLAIRLEGARGEITGTDQIRWTRNQRTPYVPSPLFYRGKLYFLRHYQGILTQVDAQTGEETIGPFRLSGLGDLYASPVAAADRLYLVDREGTTFVVSHSQIPKLLSVNRLDDRFSASPAMVGKQLFLRGEKYLYCLQSD